MFPSKDKKNKQLAESDITLNIQKKLIQHSIPTAKNERHVRNMRVCVLHKKTIGLRKKKKDRSVQPERKQGFVSKFPAVAAQKRKNEPAGKSLQIGGHLGEVSCLGNGRNLFAM